MVWREPKQLEASGMMARILTAAILSALIALPAASEQRHPIKPMVITIETVPAAKMRYPTVGDWQFQPDGSLHITVTRMHDRRYETLVAAHELVEAVLCWQAGISEAAVDAFDQAYEARRRPGDLTEPGDSRQAPYHHQHVAATWLERHLARLLKVNWRAYARAVDEAGR
jgi:hypothetical protein